MTTSNEKLTWRDVFDSYKFPNPGATIEKVNKFLYEKTLYEYFSFNGIIYKVMNPAQFTMKKSNTKMTIVENLQ